MNFKGSNKEYKTTTNKRVFKICHFAQQDMCCLACSKRRRRKYYRIFEYGDKKFVRTPNWKLVSKNRKQWMKKPIKFSKSKIIYNNSFTDITW